MAYDEGLAQRVRELLENEPDFQEKKMFGGLCFLIQGNMACGIIRSLHGRLFVQEPQRIIPAEAGHAVL